MIKGVIAVVVLGVLAFAFYSIGKWKSDKNFEVSASTPIAARVDNVDGDVGIAPEINNQDQTNVDWLKASTNTPLSVGDRIYARDGAHAGIELNARSFVRLDPNASLDIVSMTDQRTQLALRGGSAMFDCAGLASGEFFEVETPDGAVDFDKPGMYQISVEDNGNVSISVLSGEAQVVGMTGSGQILQGHTLTLTGTGQSTQATDSQIAPAVAGSVVNDFYRYRRPKTYDGRYEDYNAYLNDPYYFEPYRQSASYRYFNQDDSYIAGIEDLDDYRQWQDDPTYGHCWYPAVDAGWVPYSDGYWDSDYPWGATWVSSEQWGWAPFTMDDGRLSVIGGVGFRARAKRGWPMLRLW